MRWKIAIFAYRSLNDDIVDRRGNAVILDMFRSVL